MNKPKTIICDIDGTLLYHHGDLHAQMSEKSPENLAGHLKNRDAHKRGVSRKSSPLNADYDKDMAELRIKIKHAKEDIWEDDKKKWENK